MEFYRKYRPSTLKGLVDQPEAVKMLQGLLAKKSLPHAIVIHGPSGCGKTTIARILKDKLECSDSDFNEMNCADLRGVDTVREIRRRMTLSPVAGKCRIWLIDEAHQLTEDAQDAFLKMLEDTPSHVYFILATTEANKLRGTILTRCTEVKVVPLSVPGMQALLKKVASKEGFTLTEDVMDRIVEVAEGSARKALVLLNQVSEMTDEDDQLNCVLNSDSKAKAIELARALLNPRTNWSDVAKLLKTIDEDAESLRRMVLGYASSVMLGGGKMAPRAFKMADVFQNHLYDSGKSGLVTYCYAVIHSK